MIVAECFEKIRINPGNFADGRKTFEVINYDDPKQFEEERAYIEEIFTPLVLKCKELGRAMRIGTNHGSLSARILSYYGDTPRGMVQSAFEFAEICRKHDYHNFGEACGVVRGQGGRLSKRAWRSACRCADGGAHVVGLCDGHVPRLLWHAPAPPVVNHGLDTLSHAVFSMKASNPLVMVSAYRLLAEEMYKRGWDYPLHLGVTEAGEGEDGRMKSAIGIGALLMDGLGDTIRVSLTEDPEYEIDPCQRLAKVGETACAEGWGVADFGERLRDTHAFARRVGDLPEQVAEDGDYDYRGLLHRDGTVFSAVTLAGLKQADVSLGGEGGRGRKMREEAAACSRLSLSPGSSRQM
eukprot:300891-Chlamydomonas_euryale.AAC.13